MRVKYNRERGFKDMSMDYEAVMHFLQETLQNLAYIDGDDIPNINLYMDQVTTFMDEHLASTKRATDDKILTKTMINNYTKNNLLPPPEKKKYSKEHMLIMLFIYYFKNVIVIKDIEAILNPITKQFFQSDSPVSMADIYEEILSGEKAQMSVRQDAIIAMFTQSSMAFADVELENKEYLQLFSFLCSLSFDIYQKKFLIEKLIDEFCTVKSETPKE